jgi:hypothetical protein
MVLSILILIASRGVMQQVAPPPETKQFDFWVGEWTCTGEMIAPDGKKTKTEGQNTIKRTFDGHVVEESFRMGEFKGTSVSVYNPKSKLWQQTWVDNQGSYIALSGEYKDGKMILTTLPRPKAPKTASRMIFHDIKPNSFTWDWESTADGGKTWKLAWRLNYVRK